MRVKLQLVICNDEGQEETVTDVSALNKNQQRIEHLGLTLAEAKHLCAVKAHCRNVERPPVYRYWMSRWS